MGRPRNPDIDVALLEAAEETLFAHGYGALSIEGLALKAGVAKTTAYRRFASVEHVIVALLASWQRGVPVPKEGDLRTRVLGLALPLARNLDPAPMRRVVSELAAAAARDHDLRTRISALWRSRREAAAHMLQEVLGG